MNITSKKALLVVGFLMYVANASAQPTPPQTGEKPLILTVTPGELGVLGKALGKLPFEEAAPLMGKLQQQVTQQQVGPPQAPGASTPTPTPEPAKP